jgi:hypothetical protein
MSPKGDYTGCGNDLFVLATDIGGAGIQSSAADQSLSSNIDTNKNIYEMQVVSSYTVSPLVSLTSFPLLGSIPGLGQPVTLSFAASRPIEHPGGIQTAASQGSTGAPASNNITWRTPNIYQQIKNVGQTVVTVNVLQVPSQVNPSNPLNPWYPTGITVLPGQTPG